MITIKCIETRDVYVLSGDDETINVRIYNDLAAALAGLMKNDVYLKMHQKDLEHRIAIAKLTGFNHAFHAHEKAYLLKNPMHSKMFVSSAPQLMDKSYYKELMRKLNAKMLQNQITFKSSK